MLAFNFKSTNHLVCQLICTFFYVGKIKIAPGTFGSLAAIPLWLILNKFLQISSFSVEFITIFWLIFLLIIFFIGTYYSNIHQDITGQKDSGEIVIDEVLGQIIAIVLSYYIFSKYFISDLSLVIYYIAIFLLFRLFDILKPSIIGLADQKLKGGYSVMLDDVFAGIFSALVINSIILLKITFNL